MNKEALTRLDGFTGTEHYYQHSPKLVYTDGVKHLVQNADAYWLLDLIGSYQGIASHDDMLKDLQFWTLRPYPTDPAASPRFKNLLAMHLEPHPSAYALCERDSGNPAILQEIATTDFPFDTLPEAKIWVGPTELGNGKIVNVAYLPSEH